jgi:aerobic carbon-monoxide dehydrogenase large subunit
MALARYLRAPASSSAATERHRLADSLSWTTGAFLATSDPTQVKTIADIAMYAHGSGALPPGVDGGLDAQTVYTD